MNIDYNAIIALTAVIASITAIYSVRAESKRSTYNLGVNLLFKMNDIFTNQEFLKKRRKAAKFLLRKETDFEKWDCLELDDILDFFQTIGSLTKKGVIDQTLAWEFFVYWLDFYYVITKEYIEYCNLSNPGTWADLVWLYQKFVKTTIKDQRKPYVLPTEKEIIDFLRNYEGKLAVSTK